MSKSLAEKVDWLFRTRLSARGRQYTYGQVQRATGNRVTASYVWRLRTGAMSNPGLSTLETLAGFFEVPLSYFAEGGEYLEPSLTITNTLPGEKAPRDKVLADLQMHASKLPDDKLYSVIGVVEYLRRQEDAVTSTLAG